MLTTQKLREWGANTDEALARCLNNESFYLKLVGKAIQDANFDRLKTACEAGNLGEAFEAAHALKGTMANLALTPILRPVSEMTELLRGRTETDYAPMLEETARQRNILLDMM